MQRFTIYLFISVRRSGSVASLPRLAAGGSIGLTNTWRCMCSFELWWWKENPSETFRASYRNK